MKSANRTILIAGMGTSPAVLTETVWALAQQEQPVVPDEIVVITTKSGKDALRTAIMPETSSVWFTSMVTLQSKPKTDILQQTGYKSFFADQCFVTGVTKLICAVK